MPKAVRSSAKAQAVLSSHVVERLRKAGADDASASELADLVAGLSTSDWAVLKVLTKGLPHPDGVQVHMSGEPARLGELIDRIQKTNRLEELRVLIRGIPAQIQVAEVQVGLEM